MQKIQHIFQTKTWNYQKTTTITAYFNIKILTAYSYLRTLFDHNTAQWFTPNGKLKKITTISLLHSLAIQNFTSHTVLCTSLVPLYTLHCLVGRKMYVLCFTYNLVPSWSTAVVWLWTILFKHVLRRLLCMPL